MKLADMGLQPLALGTHVTYTHRASSYSYTSDLRDLPARDRRRVRRLLWADRSRHHQPVSMPVRARVGMRSTDTLTRCVMVWPEQGTGVICGLTARQEGVYGAWRASPPDDYEQPYLDQREAYPLYIVRTVLNGPQLLVPPWACAPVQDTSLAASINEMCAATTGAVMGA